jgi:glycosyltransferase involved in cell wall biosynthesis
MAGEVRQAVAEHGPPDMVLATSMLDLAGLLGLLRRELTGVPAALYLHENQITYPAVSRTKEQSFHGLVTWASLLAADRVAANSAFHRDELFTALPGLLRSFPDRRHDHLVDDVAAKTTVLPVGVDLERLSPVPPKEDGPLTILWNHRWDPDKGIGEFLDVLGDLADDGADFRVLLAGEPFVFQPDQHAAAVARLGDRVVSAGHLPDDEYVAALHRADVVVSTALQEFFGVSVVEAMFAGAMPLLPDRLVYPERVPEPHRERCLYRGRAGLRRSLEWVIGDPGEARRIGGRLAGTAARFDWSALIDDYDAWLAGS